MTDITHITDFLGGVPTPDAWIQEAVKPQNLPLLLADHASNELAAAQSAMTIMKRYRAVHPGVAKTGGTASNPKDRYPGNHSLLNKMSRLAREELRHFEQVIAIMKSRGIDYPQISASRYAQGLRKEMRNQEPARLVDTLLIGAIIEARSCERFAALVPVLDEELAQFYASLLKSESRHFRDYLQLARDASSAEEVEERLPILLAAERELIVAGDTEFRFHSGPPQ